MIRLSSLILACLGTPAFAIDSCLVGIWEADGADMATVLGAQMNGSASFQGGRTSLEIDEFGNMTLLAEDMAFAVNVPDTPTINITVNGYAEGAMNADDGRNYVANAPDYNLVGSAVVLGQRMDIPVSSASGAGWGTSRGIYGCTEDSIAFEATELGSIPRSWRRIR